MAKVQPNWLIMWTLFMRWSIALLILIDAMFLFYLITKFGRRLSARPFATRRSSCCASVIANFYRCSFICSRLNEVVCDLLLTSSHWKKAQLPSTLRRLYHDRAIGVLANECWKKSRLQIDFNCSKLSNISVALQRLFIDQEHWFLWWKYNEFGQRIRFFFSKIDGP